MTEYHNGNIFKNYFRLFKFKKHYYNGYTFKRSLLLSHSVNNLHFFMWFEK